MPTAPTQGNGGFQGTVMPMPTPDKVDPNACIMNCDAGRPTPPVTGNQTPPTVTQAPPTGQQQQSAPDRVTNASERAADRAERDARKRAIQDLLFECDPNSSPDQAVNSGLLSSGVPGAGTTQQGSLGDCWVIASFMGFQVSEAGRAGLAKLITASPNGGYDVRLGASCKTFHVDKVFAKGAKQSGSQGVISVLEAAYRQTSSLAPYEMCAGYFAFSAQKTITGQGSEHHVDLSPVSNKMRDRLTNDADDINKLIGEGRSVVLGTSSDSDFVTDVSTSGGLEPSKRVKIAGQHQYVVTKAAKDGVWVMNPWGSDNRYDGGGEIWVPRAQIEESFSDVAISAPISAAANKEC